MITATTWVPRGFAAPFPTKYNFDEEEFKRISELAKLQLDDAKEDLEAAKEKIDADASSGDDESDAEVETNAVRSKGYNSSLISHMYLTDKT